MIAIGSYFVFIMFVMGTICDIPTFISNGELICNDTQLYENNKIRNNFPYLIAICISPGGQISILLKFNYINIHVLAESKQFFKDILNEHNKYRKKHGAPDLVFSDEVSNNIFLLLFI